MDNTTQTEIKGLGPEVSLVRVVSRCLFSFFLPLAVLLAVGIGALAFLSQNVSTLSGPRWVKTPCTVKYAQISYMYSERTNSNYYQPRVTLCYQVQNQNYETICQGRPMSCCFPWDVKQWIDQYPVGKTVFCYISASNPYRVLLQRNYAEAVYPVLLPLSLLCLVLVLIHRVVLGFFRTETQLPAQPAPEAAQPWAAYPSHFIHARTVSFRR